MMELKQTQTDNWYLLGIGTLGSKRISIVCLEPNGQSVDCMQINLTSPNIQHSIIGQTYPTDLDCCGCSYEFEAFRFSNSLIPSMKANFEHYS